MKPILLLLITLALLPSYARGQSERLGAVKGTILDVETREPMIGANVLLQGTATGTTSDLSGIFSLERVPVGNYTLVVSYIGYESVAKTDVIVRSDRSTFVEIELRMTAIQAEGLVVHAGYFSEGLDQPVSVVGLSGEEVRRAPGAAGDVSRIVYGLPAVAKVNDTRNSLIVRGGGPTENGFYVDNIEIPNINHFPEQGSSGGPIGIVNVDFIRGVDFYTGGFSAAYGDRLSSIMDIDFRKGNPEETDIQLDLNLAGFGTIAEGPIPGTRGSYLLSARRSFLDLIVGMIEEEETSIPQYSDFQGKLFFDLAPQHKLSVLDIYSRDNISLSGEDAIEDGENLYTDFQFQTNTAGANWMFLWGERGHSNTSLAHTWSSYDYLLFETRHLANTGSPKTLLDMTPTESELKLRNVNHYRVSSESGFDFGMEVKHIRANYSNFYGSYNDELGNPTEAFRVDEKIDASKFFAFLSHKYSPTSKLTLTTGLRLGYYSYNGKTGLSPRLSASYAATSTLSFNAAAGVFRQHLPLPLLSQNVSNKDLADPTAYHVIVGFQKLLAEDTRLTIEVYDKEYVRFPLDPVQPQLFVIDQVVQTGLYFNSNPLVDEGRAYTRGVELMLQKKLARNVYGLLSASYFRSRYRDYLGEWHNRDFDNRVTFQAEGGYKPNNKWEFSMRWLYGGGRPYTPFDEAASTEAVRGVLDVNSINGDRLPAYHALNVRFDRRFHYRHANLIAYLSVWNAYGRTNVSGYQWNELTNAPEATEQWGLLPIFGLELEF